MIFLDVQSINIVCMHGTIKLIRNSLYVFLLKQIMMKLKKSSALFCQYHFVSYLVGIAALMSLC